MNSVEIIVKDGEGREVNPYQMGFDTKYREFEQSAKPHPAPGIKDCTRMARLQWQYNKPNQISWFNCEEDERDFYSEFGCNFRQVWVLSPAGETNLKTENMKTGIELIAEERQRQIDVYGYTDEHIMALNSALNENLHAQK